jgi:hypothetical protein
LLGVSYESDRLNFHWFDADRAALQAKLENTFRGTQVQITSTSDDNQIALIHVSYDREPGTYFVLDQKKARWNSSNGRGKSIRPGSASGNRFPT